MMLDGVLCSLISVKHHNLHVCLILWTACKTLLDSCMHVTLGCQPNPNLGKFGPRILVVYSVL